MWQLTQQADRHKIRIRDPVRQLMSMTALTGDLGKTDLQVPKHYAGPRAFRLRPVEPTALHLIVPALGPGSGPSPRAAIDLYRADYLA